MIKDSKISENMPEDQILHGGDTGDTGDGDFKVNDFPTEAFPRAVSGFIRETSESLVCPPELVGVPLLVMCASAIGNSRVIRVKSDWEESATLYAACIALPGSKKTPAASKATKPLHKEQARLNREYRDQKKEYEKELRRYKKDDGEGEPPTEPVIGSTFVDDTTVEALMEALRDNPRGLMVAVDELGGWVRSMDQYKSGKGSDRQKYLSLWSNSPVKVDRKKQETIALDRPFISIYGGIQPGILPEIANGREDGMLDRFLLSYPDSVPSHWSDSEVSEESKQAVLDLYDKLRSLHMDLDDYGDPNPSLVHFDTDAKEVFKELVNDHNREADQPGFPNRLRGPWAKMEAYIARLTLILSLVRSVSEGSPKRIEMRDVLAAESLLGYFKSHARKVYGVLYEADPKDQFAVDVVGFLEAMGGNFQDTPSVVHHVIRSEHKPTNVENLTKWLKEVSNRTNAINVDQPHIGRGNDKKRGLRISLRNAVPAVPTVPAEAEPLTQREAVTGWNRIMDGWGENGIIQRLVDGKASKDDIMEKATRLVLYALDRPTHDWESHVAEVEGCIDRRYKDKISHLTEPVPF